MAENETNEVEETTESGGSGSGARTAVKAAAAAAVTGAAAMAARKALSHSNGGSSNGDQAPTKKGKGGSSTLLTSIASGGWDAARDAVIPLAEDAAGAAGTWLGKNGPEIVVGDGMADGDGIAVDVELERLRPLAQRRDEDEGAALRAGQAPEDRGPLTDDEDAARARRRAGTLLTDWRGGGR